LGAKLLRLAQGVDIGSVITQVDSGIELMAPDKLAQGRALVSLHRRSKFKHQPSVEQFQTVFGRNRQQARAVLNLDGRGIGGLAVVDGQSQTFVFELHCRGQAGPNLGNSGLELGSKRGRFGHRLNSPIDPGFKAVIAHIDETGQPDSSLNVGGGPAGYHGHQGQPGLQFPE
jgi:hypothetical protein